VDGQTEAKSYVTISQSLAGQPLSGLNSAAFVEGLPSSADIAAAAAGNPTVLAAFAHPGEALGLMTLGAGSAGTQNILTNTYTSIAAFQIDTSQLGSFTDVKVGLFNPTLVDAGFDSLTFTVQNGANVTTETFTSLAAADAFFQDQVLDLGNLGNGYQNLSFALSYTGYDPQGPESFDVGLGVGAFLPAVSSIPEPGSLAALLSLLATCGVAGVGRRLATWRPARRDA
jgi:hypothetical protein